MIFRPPRALRLLLPWVLLASAQAAVDYEKDIKPLFKERCVSCHGSVKQKGDLRLDAGSLIGKDVRGELVSRVISEDEDERMPPEGARLTPVQVANLREWLAAGAPFPKDEVVPRKPSEHWSFQPIRRPEVPESAHEHPVDAFVFGRRPLPSRATPGALLRRVNLDLIGLPPTLLEQEEFEHSTQGTHGADGTNPAYEEVIDRLLARPEHGERWARHWLDVVRYADSNGYERDAAKPFVWRYRDYVIDSLNKDKPFDRFAVEQLAGDVRESVDEELNAERVIATGFLRLGHWDDEPADPATDRYDQLDDIVSTTGQAFLGLTIGCARCHDHKFEPLSTKDYYSLVAVFNPLERPAKGRTELTVQVADTEVYAWKRKEGEAPATHVLLRGSATRPGDRVEPAAPAILSPKAFNQDARLDLARWIASPQNPLTARVIVNRVWQQHFGQGLVTTANDFGLMGAVPSNPELLDWLAHWFMHEAGWSLKKLHRLILTSRAWQASSGEQRAKGVESRPSGIASGSTPYRYRRLEVEAIRDSMLFVSGQLNPKRFGPAMRPAIPKAALEANTDKEKIWQVSSESEASRRSIYMFIKRGLVVPMLETLDLADTVSSCPQRQVTTVAPQALTLFNSDFVNEQARHFAARLKREAGDDAEQQVRLSWRLALCREPSPDELAKMQAFLREESLEQLCRVVLNLNEFVYPE